MTTQRNHSLRMDFYPCPAQVSLLRRFVTDFFGKLPLGADLVARLALTTHELLENAMKYSRDGMARLEVDVEHDGGEAVEVRTRNKSVPGNIGALKKQFAEMNEYNDSWQYYGLAMERTATRVEGSGLGLARVRAEAEMALSLHVDGDVVEIHATSRTK